MAYKIKILLSNFGIILDLERSCCDSTESSSFSSSKIIILRCWGTFVTTKTPALAINSKPEFIWISPVFL